MSFSFSDICMVSFESWMSSEFSIILFNTILDEINIAFVLRILAIMSFLSHHSWNLFKSALRRFVRCRTEGSEEERVASSAKKSNAQHVMDNGKSLIYTRNRTGPRTDPWGTPAEISFGSDSLAETCTCCVLFVTYDSNHDSELWLNLYAANLWRSSLWFTKSNALDKSRKTVPTVSLSFRAFNQLSSILVKAVWQKCDCLKPNWFLYRSLFVSKKSIIQ